MVLNKGENKEGDKKEYSGSRNGSPDELPLSIEIMRSNFRTSLKFEFY